jgi:DNA segregation ATPase FtsK/SpoIIIE-like protein
VNRSGAKAIISVFLLIIFSVIILLAIDDMYLKNKYFSLISKNVDFNLKNLFGSFSLFLCAAGILSSVLVLSKAKTASKIFFITGMTMLSSFFLLFFESTRMFGLSGGVIGVKLDSVFSHSDFMIRLGVFFFWFSTAIFLALFPARNLISGLIINLISLVFGISKEDAGSGKTKTKKGNDKTGEKKNNVKVVFNARQHTHNGRKTAKIPWLAKVVYENTSDRLEVPLFPDRNESAKKFKLDSKTDYTQNFVEVDTFSISNDKEVHTKVDNDEYFEKVKEDWPENWKNEKTVQLAPEIYDEPLELGQGIETRALIPDNMDPDDVIDAEIINENDQMIDKLIEEKSSVNIDEIFDKNFNKKSPFASQDGTDQENFTLPNSRILKKGEVKNYSKLFKAHERESAMILESTLMEFDLKAEVCEIIHGPVVTLYKLIPAPGIKLSKIESLSNNLALRLAAQSIRIIAPIPGEKVVGIEIPNKKRELVSFKEIVNSEVFTDSKHNIPVGLGKDIYGNIIVVDLYKMPHILIAGATGAGKSVCVNSFISSILFSKTPEDVRLVFIDPKIVELKPYNNIPHLLTPVVTESRQALNTLKFLLYEMERRYSLLDEMGVRDIVDYRKMHAKKTYLEQLPFIVCFVDEFADLMTTSGKEAEILFARLAAKARAVGILLVLATQRPSADVITGLIKANIPARIAFQVISLQDSRIILDQKGAEKLLGQGDMLYLSPSQPFPIRIQGAYLSKEEVDSIAEHWKSIASPKYIDINEFINIDEEDSGEFAVDGESKDPLYEQAIEIVYQTKKASASYLQRRLNIGYNRAARMVEEMEALGIVGPQRGAKAREVIGILGDKK